MNDERLAQLEELAERAVSDHVWTYIPETNEVIFSSESGGGLVAEIPAGDTDLGAFIAETAEAVPQLIAEVRRLRRIFRRIADGVGAER